MQAVLDRLKGYVRQTNERCEAFQKQKAEEDAKSAAQARERKQRIEAAAAGLDFSTDDD